MRTRRSPRNQDRLWRELGQQGRCTLDHRALQQELIDKGIPGSCPDCDVQLHPAVAGAVWAPTLYDEVVKRGIPHASHYSDLYLPATEEVRTILLYYGHHKRGNRSTPTTFVNQVEGGTWYDIPFAYAPYWRERADNATR